MEVLAISGNELRDDGIRYLACTLKHNQVLKTLHLYGCRLSAKYLADSLTTNKYLEELNISGNELCDIGIQHLAHALTVNQGLKKLNMQKSMLTSSHVENIAIFCGVRRITTKSVPVLTEALKNNHTLIELYLPNDLESSISGIEKAVNDVRMRNELPAITVTGKISHICFV